MNSHLCWPKTLDHLPSLVLHVSEGCNLGCAYCFADQGRYGQKHARWMKPDRAVEIITQIYNRYQAVDFIKFFGGEPFLNVPAIKAACEFIGVLYSTGRISTMPRLTAVSNLTLLNKGILELVEKWNINVTASIDGPRDLHNYFRVFHNNKGSFDRVDKNILDMRKLIGQPKAIEAVYGPHHYRAGFSVSDIHEYLQDRYDVDYVFMHTMQMEHLEKNMFGEEFLDKYAAAIYDQGVQYGKFLVERAQRTGSFRVVTGLVRNIISSDKVNAHCNLGVSSITVGADGKTWPCYMFIGKEEFLMASECNSGALGGDRFLAVQGLFLQNKKSDNPECSRCSIMKTCQSCPGSMHTFNGSINSYLPVTCEYETGRVEGVMLGLNDLVTSKEDWAKFMKSVETENVLAA